MYSSLAKQRQAIDVTLHRVSFFHPVPGASHCRHSQDNDTIATGLQGARTIAARFVPLRGYALITEVDEAGTIIGGHEQVTRRVSL